ncbi:hypothetical protein HO173_001323 [Letharia columbiana]|uniref:Uncharacterized protein n=1 Tax=Letharia columbiana TaxID=112416 RepID=A0A8H6L9N4_9LECA|nr:uncharacterized protein HO173_001323 [Letharia columbiana]KAF6240651.1 hypothetical protein HO173_001323 [Letharia columbiana]
MENTAEKPSGNKATIVKNTAQLSKIPRHMLSTANAENTAEKLGESGETKRQKATIVKNTAQLQDPTSYASTVPHQIITQQAENTTATSLSSPLHKEKRRNYNRQMREHAENTMENMEKQAAKGHHRQEHGSAPKIPRHMLSTVPHQIITQQAENTTQLGLSSPLH